MVGLFLEPGVALNSPALIRPHPERQLVKNIDARTLVVLGATFVGSRLSFEMHGL